MSSDVPISVYNTFSPKIANRFVRTDTFPLELPINQCLYELKKTKCFHYPEKYFSVVSFHIENDLETCHCNDCLEYNTAGCFQVVIEHRTLKTGSQPVIEYIEQFMKDIETNTTHFIVNRP